MSTTTHAIDNIRTAHRQREGADFGVRRLFPSDGLSYLDPFLLIDEMARPTKPRAKPSARAITRAAASRP